VASVNIGFELKIFVYVITLAWPVVYIGTSLDSREYLGLFE